ncbi:DUF1801 domain-containing protein [Glycomyces albidus]|jgi:hypothetical protein|uniref:DUF1801 domain-containing protein n=1 Tax=Glycomyces albidus TaxID=2656774 RepID=A0A6L5G7F0_9ACTN|nr:DUF1801 domain-containing protein [Glycomyces albidus]MQM25541.1 DUF1801 domain-containing protein [Glycomyces albidus]
MTAQQDFDELFDRVTVPRRRADAARLLQIMQEVTGEEPALWPGSIIGFGTYHYRYATGREGDTVKVGFAPRASALVLYGLIRRYGTGTEDFEHRDLFERLGTYSTGKGCLYIKYLDDVDLDVLKTLVRLAHDAD